MLDGEQVAKRTFDVEAFYAEVGVTARERGPIRQCLVRGLKEYYESTVGYDKYGAETVLHLTRQLGVPQVYGFAVQRILHDRRISEDTKCRVATRALNVVSYGEDQGVPGTLLSAISFLASHGRLAAVDARYVLTVTAGDDAPVREMVKGEIISLLRWLLDCDEIAPSERLFWGHSLVSRRQEDAGAKEMIDLLLGHAAFPQSQRAELARAWIHRRQPHLDVETHDAGEEPRTLFLSHHLPFWVAHVTSWSSLPMMRHGLVWLARIEGSPIEIIETYFDRHGPYAEQLCAGIADIMHEHHAAMPVDRIKAIIDDGIATPGSGAIRRRFYRLGHELFGPSYLERASDDTAGSIRQWAQRRLSLSL
jgi:hypothetical protein